MRRARAEEWMDDPAVDPRSLAGNFDDIERANRLFGGIAPVRAAVFASTAESLLDVACGSGDIARALMAEARRRGRRMDIVALDAGPSVLAIAAARTRDAAIAFRLGDARALPFADGAFDVATCNLALHHFEPDDAVTVLRELRRVSRLTALVCDLRRSMPAYAVARAYAALLATNRLTRHDAPLSVQRAYTPGEALDLARRAGWAAPRVRRAPFFRMVLRDG